MAGSTMASNSLDGSTFAAGYPNGQRGTYSGGLDRSGSFREGLESRSLASGSGGLRNGAPPADFPPLTQFLTLEQFSLGEQKYTRYNELRRVLGVPVEEQHTFGSLLSKPLPSMALEEVKRFRLSLQESSNRARDRRKGFNESIVKVDKYRNILLKKQQRNEVPPSEKSGSSNLLKLGGQIHQNSSDPVIQKLEERTKNVVPNKRARSSVADVRSEVRGVVPMRSGTVTDKDKSMLLDNKQSMLRTCNGVPMPSEDKLRGLPPGGDGWEKRLKRKRSVGTMVTRIPDSDRELKQPLQRPNSDPRSRSCDGLGFRPGSFNGISGANKVDPGSQLSGPSSRVMPKNDMDSGSLPSDGREHSAGVDKERIIAKGSNKLNIREDVQVGSRSPLTKVKASRALRTASVVVMNTASNFPRPSGGIDGWEQPSCSNKVHPLIGAANRKQSLPMGSSSPPVAQWVGQRPQKISRTRRANVVSPVSNFEEAPILSEGYATPDVGARLTTVESNGLLLSRGVTSNAHQLKLKMESGPSPVGISESEESGAIQNKSKDEGIANGAVAPTFVLLSKKNKVSLKEEIGDGVRRQGRSGRGSILSKACLPVAKEKLENIDTTRPLKSGRPGSDKSERLGRPPSKKASDRKAYIRSGQILNSGSSELTGESDDDREELLAAASAARNASYIACSSSFWKTIEPVFSFVSLEEINYVKHQIIFADELDESLCHILDADYNVMGELACQAISASHISFPVEQVSQIHVVGMHNYAGTVCAADEPSPVKTSSGRLETEKWLERIIPLSQRLLSAFISEYEMEKFDCIIEQGDAFLQSSSDYSPYGSNTHVENDQEADLIKSEYELDLDFKHKKNYVSDNILCNGSIASSNIRSPNIQNFISGEELLEGNDVLRNTDTGHLSEFKQANINSLRSTSSGLSGGPPYDSQFEHMSLDDRILMELHSIGLYPNTVPDIAEGEDEEIDKVISELMMRLYEQVRENKSQLFKLGKAIQDRKQIEERNLEQLAMSKLVETAYKKLIGGRGSHGSSHKSGASKLSKQLALAFAKRTLARCKKFEETGRSCFSEPAFHDVLFSAPLYSNNAKCFDASGVTSIGERHGFSHKLDRGESDLIHDFSQMSEQSFDKTDQISNRGKKREVLLDDVVTSAASRAISHSPPGGAKWKKTDKDKDQKDTVTRNSASKAGPPSFVNVRGERKMKTKPKQKIAQLSTSGNGLGRVTETTSYGMPSMWESSETVNSGRTRVNQESELPCSSTQDLSKEIEDSIFTNLPLHEIDSIDELDVTDGLGGQGQDIGSWLNVDEDALQDHDLVGLEIPMDDLSELKLNF